MRPRLSFLVPFRDTDGTRTRARDWILARWRAFYPDAEFVLASDDGADPFCKPMAVNTAAAQATGDLFAILDADTWVEPQWVAKALGHLASGRFKWAIPARRSYRLTRAFSDRLLSLPPDGELPRIASSREVVEQTGFVAGFLHIVPREGFEAVGGMDERFRGWGGEDTCFTRALDVVWGPHVQVPGVVISLWHARPRGAGGRVWEGQTADHYEIRQQLARRYGMARSRPQMLELLQR